MHKPRKPLKLWELKAEEMNKQGGSQERQAISEELTENQQVLDQIFAGCADVASRNFMLPTTPPTPARLYLLKGAQDKTIVNDSIIAPLTSREKVTNASIPNLISAHQIKEISTIHEAVSEILNGLTVLFIEGSQKAWAINAKEAPIRGIEEPEAQALVRGPRDGMIESLEINLALVRKRLRTPSLKVTTLTIGRKSNTNIAVLHMEGVADPKVLEELHTRLDKIDIDGIMDSGELEQLIEDSTISPFPQIGNTERPDNVAAALLNGRIAIMADNSPFALIIPNVLTDMLQASDDYYERFYFSSAIRLLRYILSIIALTGPAAYVAITTYHHEMIPTTLLITLTQARSGVPFPAVVEAGLMELAFEALREAGLRLPKPIGQAVSIVGALIIGQAAVEAGLVSPIMVIVVAGTGIASFAIPAFNGAIVTRLLKFPFLILAAVLGLYGVFLGFAFMLVHLVSLRSFGVPYMSPLAPITLRDWQDLIVRLPTWAITQRPSFIAKGGNTQRQVTDTRGVQPADDSGKEQ